MPGIYKIVCNLTEDCYIGSAKNLKTRLSRHRSSLRVNKHYNRHLQNAWNKYGEENFSFEIIDVTSDITTLIEREQHWMDLLSPKYNIRKKAESNLGLKHSEESKQKIKDANIGKTISEETLERIREAIKVRKLPPFTEERREKSRQNITKYNKSTEHRKAASISGKLNGPENLKKAHENKRVKFESITPQIFKLRNQGLLGKEIAEKLGISLITVRRKLNGKRYSKT